MEPEHMKALAGLVALDPRCDEAYCSLTGVLIQAWSQSEGTLRYHCPDGDCVYQTRDTYDRFRRVKEKLATVAHYPGLVEECLGELRKLNPLLVDGHWVLEKTLASRVRTVTVQDASTPASLLHEVARAFRQRLLVGVPDRLAQHVTLPQELLVRHQHFAWLTYGGAFDLALTLAECAFSGCCAWRSACRG